MNIQAKTILVNLSILSLMLIADYVAIINKGSMKIVVIAVISSLALLLVTNFPVKFAQRIVTAITLTLSIIVSLTGGILANMPVEPVSRIFTGFTLMMNFVIMVISTTLIESVENLKNLSAKAANNLSIATIMTVTTYADGTYHCHGLLLVFFALPINTLLVYLEYKIYCFNNSRA